MQLARPIVGVFVHILLLLLKKGRDHRNTRFSEQRCLTLGYDGAARAQVPHKLTLPHSPLLSPLYFRQFLNMVFMSLTNSSLVQYKPPFSFFSMLEMSMGTCNGTCWVTGRWKKHVLICTRQRDHAALSHSKAWSLQRPGSQGQG